MRTNHLAALGAALLLATGCSADANRTRLSVYAASSLTDAFGTLEVLFERGHPDVDVALIFAGSQILRIQIEQGAPADVFASADPEHMEALLQAGLVSESRVFARNELVLVVPVENPADIESFAELPAARRVVLGTPAVPVGRYARAALAAADTHVRPGFQAAVLANVVSEETNVRLARSKVELGEADAAIVYRTDAQASDALRAIPIPDEVNVRADYLLGLIERGGRSPVAEAWIGLLLSPEGQAVLERHGFAVR